ncbi:carbohydrate ABC transporter permease [Paenibacillus sp.]|uniref:carbohydrate ABC transporter permease n=1 Tax=Paenibacillus sp. TaxID=58172 RepID=UPI0028A9C19C|nr:carbohydrate ABC transporter permease [Paenibacillus sp.]
MKIRKIDWMWQGILAIILILIFASPIYVLVGVALKSPSDMSSMWVLPSYINIENFTVAINEGKILLSMINSLIITFVTVILIVFAGAFASYPLARINTHLNKFVKAFTLGIMIVPPLSILVPLYATLVNIGGVDSYWGIVLTLLTFELPLSIYLYTNFVSSIPKALDEAGSIDGCGPIRTFFSIILPQLKPVTASVIILAGVHCWNDYQFSLYILQNPEYKTVTLAISSFFSQTTSNLNAAAASALLAILPITLVFLFLQKYFIKGMVDSAIK